MKVGELKVEQWSIDEIFPYDKNAKIHTEVQIESLAKVIKAQGWDVPIVVDKDGIIIKGHGRRLAALSLGMKRVPVICRRDLTPEEVKAARLSDNRVAFGEYDTAMIREEISALNADGFDVSSMGFDSRELDMMLKELDEIDAGAFESAPSASAASGASEDKPKPAKVSKMSLASVLGFESVNQDYQRDLVKFLSYAESTTGKVGEEAFCEFVRQVIQEIEAKV